MRASAFSLSVSLFVSLCLSFSLSLPNGSTIVTHELYFLLPNKVQEVLQVNTAVPMVGTTYNVGVHFDGPQDPCDGSDGPPEISSCISTRSRIFEIADTTLVASRKFLAALPRWREGEWREWAHTRANRTRRLQKNVQGNNVRVSVQASARGGFPRPPFSFATGAAASVRSAIHSACHPTCCSGKNSC